MKSYNDLEGISLSTYAAPKTSPRNATLSAPAFTLIFCGEACPRLCISCKDDDANGKQDSLGAELHIGEGLKLGIRR